MEHARYPDGCPKGDGFLRLSALFPRTTEGRYLVAVVFFLILLGAMTFIVWKYPDVAGLSANTEQQAHWLIAGGCLTGSFLAGTILLLIAVRHAGSKEFGAIVESTRGDDEKTKRKDEETAQAPGAMMGGAISRHLRQRYGLFWRRKVRLLLVAGDETAIEQLVPGLQESQWLEGERTVLIYGGSLASAIDTGKFAALRKLRRGRPLDGIVRVIAENQQLTPQKSDNDLRGLEKIGEALRYSAPVWLWQLCESQWSQAGRKLQPVGITLSLQAMSESVAKQLDKLLPQLREQGMSQIAEKRQYDFLLRLAQQLERGGSKRWASCLTPWLYSAQQRVPLRGLMFSQINKPETSTGEIGKETGEDIVLPLHQHAMTLPLTWKGALEGCTRMRGYRVGRPWEETLAWGFMMVALAWGAGLLLSFALNYSQITSVAGKARVLVEHPAISDSQLTALHNLRNDAGRLRQQVEDGAPWYQRLGLGHHAQLLNAMLPWYGVANNRLIRDPANDALAQKLSALVN